jgi:hypothetical protein
MIKISRSQRDALESVGLLKYRRRGFNPQDQNFSVVNKEHVSRDKTYYVVEEPEIMLFLGFYENQNLQIISKRQYDQGIINKLFNESQVQKWGEYNPNAIVFIDYAGRYRVKRIAKIMIGLGIWKPNNARKSTVVENVEAQN